MPYGSVCRCGVLSLGIWDGCHQVISPDAGYKLMVVADPDWRVTADPRPAGHPNPNVCPSFKCPTNDPFGRPLDESIWPRASP